MAYRKGIMLQLGMFSTSVDLESAAVKEQSLKTVCVGPDDTSTHAPTAIKQTRACPDCGNDSWPTFKRARVENKSDFIVVDADEVTATKDAAIGVSKSIIQITTHPTEQVRSTTIQGEGSTYYLTPSKPAFLPIYGALVDVLKRHPEWTFVGIWTAVSRPGLYEIRLHGESTLMLTPLAWSENVKVQAQPDVTIEKANQDQLDALVGGMVSDFDVDTYRNTYSEGLEALMATKTAQAGVLPEVKATTPTPKVGAVDLTALLNDALKGAA